ncbi:MAG: PBSX family phage terminase large subunit, partial [Clostridia bacterium]|nr:PBSX family phage terminase large subunit [Clostridia bacterium]
MQITTLSEKQKLLFKWAHTKEYCEKYDNIICDGAVRSGKTVIMAMSFIIWAMRYFDDCSFAIC